jgi:hypothetical protein
MQSDLITVKKKLQNGPERAIRITGYVFDCSQSWEMTDLRAISKVHDHLFANETFGTSGSDFCARILYWSK